MTGVASDRIDSEAVQVPRHHKEPALKSHLRHEAICRADDL